MANRLNFSNDTVTGGRFVELGRKSVDLKTRLQRISQVSSNNDSNQSLAGLGSLTSDSVVTPEEKKLLAQEWEHILAAYNSTVSMVGSLGVNPEEFISFQTAFSQLQSLVNDILSDMNSNSQTDGRLDVAIEAYSSAATILQNWINAYNNSLTSDISSYRLDIARLPSSPTLDSTITFTAHIYIDEIDKTEELMNNYKDQDTGLYPDLFNWFIEGTEDDDALIEEVNGKRSFSIPASDFSGDVVKVYFSSSLNVG